jgi:hypothetical protein
VGGENGQSAKNARRDRITLKLAFDNANGENIRLGKISGFTDPRHIILLSSWSPSIQFSKEK